MVRSFIAIAAAVSIPGTNVLASDRLPTLEDAGYAYEAAGQCETISVDAAPPRRLKRKGQFRDGRRIFKRALKQWGREWACQAALENHGATVDLSEYFTGKRVVVIQPLPSDAPPVPVFQLELELAGNVTETVTETVVE
ncbi:MAG: hypothetical protein ACR2OX_11080 [Methyloligellaceae bacterium]